MDGHATGWAVREPCRSIRGRGAAGPAEGLAYRKRGCASGCLGQGAAGGP